MHPVLSKTFGGLTKQYYFRQLFFALIFATLIGSFVLSAVQGAKDSTFSAVFFTFLLTANTLLYPYSRFVYESVVDFFVGNNLFVLPAVLMFAFKFLTMGICFAAAIFIAPIGLIYLYFHNSRPA